MRWSWTLGLIVLGVAAPVLVACSGKGKGAPSSGEPRATVSSGTTVTAGLKEFAIEIRQDECEAGRGSPFKATNKATTPHELMVIKSDLAPDRLPIRRQRPT